MLRLMLSKLTCTVKALRRVAVRILTAARRRHRPGEQHDQIVDPIRPGPPGPSFPHVLHVEGSEVGPACALQHLPREHDGVVVRRRLRRRIGQGAGDPMVSALVPIWKSSAQLVKHVVRRIDVKKPTPSAPCDDHPLGGTQRHLPRG